MTGDLKTTFAVMALVMACSVPAEARSSRQGQVPNGARFSCDTCHGAPNIMPGGLNLFGADVYDSLRDNTVDWPAIAALDSDGDGFSNAVELNDPDRQWQLGQPAPGGPVSNPGEPNLGICANQNLEEGEECEPGLLGGATCQSLEIGTGELSCYDICRFDISDCGYCGDGYRHPYDEACDGDDFDELTCAEVSDSLYGRLKCRDDCTVDTSGCTDEPPSTCGDGVLGWNETCDGGLFGEWSCERLGYDNGVLLCTDRCEWNADGCYFGEEPPPGWTPPPTNGGSEGPGGEAEEAGEGGTGCSSAGDASPATLLILLAFLLFRRNSSLTSRR